MGKWKEYKKLLKSINLVEFGEIFEARRIGKITLRQRDKLIYKRTGIKPEKNGGYL